MPTTRPRHQVTETPDVARALDVAARRWPGEPRSRLLIRLVHAGLSSLEEAEQSRREGRRRAIERTAGKYPEAFAEGYLDELRADWPA